MNVVGVNHLIANVNVVATINCPFCENESCGCKWNLNDGIEEGNIDHDQTMVQETSCSSDLSPYEDLKLPTFDSIYNSLGTGGADTGRRHYKSVIADRSIYKVGDLVNWHPFWGLCDWDKPWIVKTVFPLDPLDCSFYDYEITDGLSVHKVTFAEIRKMEEK